MSVYKHQQGSYRSYRVARSVNGELRQAYFPRTREGLKAAKEQDEKWSSQQTRAQKSFTGPARRWSPKPKVKRASAKSKAAPKRKAAAAAGKTAAKKKAVAKKAPAKKKAKSKARRR